MARHERLDALVEAGFIDTDQAALLAASGALLPFGTADKMIENVVGCFELPIGLGMNFVVNGRDYVVPMVVEEPSIVAAVSHAARIVRTGGGFEAEADGSIMTGQIQVIGAADIDSARDAVLEARDRLLAMADELEPGMRRRGGGAVDLDARILRDGTSRYNEMLVVHVYVDTCDAMGANLVNTMCEGLAAEIESLTGGRVYLRILSNLTDRRRVRARCRVPAAQMAWHGYDGDTISDGIVTASEFAAADPYRAATHNKGVMNGVDAVAVATGQDWRAIEAGAHAFAALSGQYGPLTRWWRDDSGALCGEIDMPMAVGTVGGPIRLHPTVELLLSILDVGSASELACVMGAVGLAQNLAALKALASTGIQRGHMSLHARSVAATAGACGDDVDVVAQTMIDERNIKVERALEIIEERTRESA